MAVTARSIAITGGRDGGSGRIEGATVTSGKGVSAAPSVVTVTANVATLVADGATPTQAHVTTLNTNYTALLADQAVGLGGADFIVIYDTTAIGSLSKFRAMLRKAEEMAAIGGLTG